MAMPAIARIAGIVGIASLRLLTLLWSATASFAAPPPHAGSPLCADCHRAQHDAWRESQHRRALQPATRETVLAPFSGERFGSGAAAAATFGRDGERFTVRAAGADGHVRSHEVAYTIGIAPLQQFVLKLDAGRLQAFDVAWDTRPRSAGGQRWFHLQDAPRPAPGSALHWSGWLYNANGRCIECHVTGFRKGFDAEARRWDTRWAEAGIGCEACHGPGAAHVAWARTDPARRGADPLPLRRPRGTQQLELCARCHAHRSLLDEADPAGQSLLDTHLPTLLASPLFHTDGQMRGEAFNHASFAQGRMHAKGVTCGDCHEPHGGRLHAEGDALCARCHSSATFARREHHHHDPALAGARCAGCHLPVVTSMQIDRRHDHGFRVPRPDLAAALGTPDACGRCHAKQARGWSARQARSWYPRLAERRDGWSETALQAKRGGDAAPWLELAEDHDRAALVRASALQSFAKHLAARLDTRALNAALPRIAALLNEFDPLLRAAAAEALAAAAPLERQSLLTPRLSDPVRAVRLAAARALAPLPPAAFTPADRAALDRALAEYVALQMRHADQPEAWDNLGTLHAERGDAASADAALRRALAIEPQRVPTLLNLADLRRAQGREAEAEAYIRQALRHAPRDATALHALGLSLLRQQRHEEALAPLADAARLAPDNPRFARVHALARDHRRRPAAAEEHRR